MSCGLPRYLGHAAATCALLAACTTTGPEAPPFVVRDSAGVRIVENSRPLLDATEAWRIHPEAEVVLGGSDVDSTAFLHQVGGATVLEDGRIVVVNAVPPMVRWYSASGDLLHGTGRPGGGPGEFGGGEGAYIYTVWRLGGDSVGTWEHVERRMQIFGPDGRYSGSVTLELPPMDLGTYPAIIGRLDRGFVVAVHDNRLPGAKGSVRRARVRYHRHHSDGKYAQEIAEGPGFVEFSTEFQRPGRPSFVDVTVLPFAPAAVAHANEDRFYYGSADAYEIAAYDTAGVLQTLIRRTTPVPALTPAILESFKNERLAAVRNPDRLADAERNLDEVPYPATLPAYRAIRVDRAGWLWVQDYPLPGEKTVNWSVFDAEGRWVTIVDLPIRFNVQDIGDDYILGIARDSLDIETVQLLRYDRVLPSGVD